MTPTIRQGRTKIPHPLRVRDLTVAAVTDVAPHLRRVTVTGPDLDDLVSTGATDHLKLFLGADGSVPPADGVVSRDLTPRAVRPGSSDRGAELDLDIVVHGGSEATTGLLARWVRDVRAGDRAVVAGPKSSKTMPSGYRRYVLGGDESALPSVARWLERLDPELPVLVLAEVHGTEDEVYLKEVADRPGVEVRWLHRGSAAAGTGTRLAEAVTALAAPGGPGDPDEDTFCWFGGEAGSLVPVRRRLRRDLGLTAAQAEVQGYWRRGVVGFDHHSPLDPNEPE